MKRAAAIQMTSTASVQENLNTVERLVAEAVSLGAECVILPENFAFMGKTETDKLAIKEAPLSGPIQNALKQLALKHGIWLVGGTIPIATDSVDRVTGTCYVWDNHGKVVARYDKIHLFDVIVTEEERYLESHTLAPGQQVVAVDTILGKMGLSICYDLRFPELYRSLMRLGSEVFVVPSAFTAITGAAHWESLLRARAIENLSYVIAAGQSGEHENGRKTFGHSMIIDPWGKILAQLDQGEGVVVADIDLQYLKSVRKRFPALEHKVLR